MSDVRVIAYTRQANGSSGIERQRTALFAFCAAQGYEVVAEYADHGKTAPRAAQRPGLARAMQAVREGQADAVVANRLDRLARNAADLGWIERSGVRILTAHESFDSDKADSRLILAAMAHVEEIERGYKF